MQKGNKYKIPKNLCQLCYETSGRFILDCYCIICEQCYARHPPKGSMCNLCGRPTKGNKIDAKQESSIKKIGQLFQNVDAGMQKLLQIHKFQNQIANRYCQHLEKQLAQYQNAVTELISINSNFYNFFNSRVKLRKSSKQTQPNVDRNHHNQRQYSTKGETTIKPNRQYASQIFQSRRSTLDLNPGGSYVRHAQMNGIRPIGKPNHNNSGNIIYKVPNINFNTAIRSSKRMTRAHDKIPPDYDQEVDYHRYRRQ